MATYVSQATYNAGTPEQRAKWTIDPGIISPNETQQTVYTPPTPAPQQTAYTSPATQQIVSGGTPAPNELSYSDKQRILMASGLAYGNPDAPEYQQLYRNLPQNQAQQQYVVVEERPYTPAPIKQQIPTQYERVGGYSSVSGNEMNFLSQKPKEAIMSPVSVGGVSEYAQPRQFIQTPAVAGVSFTEAALESGGQERQFITPNYRKRMAEEVALATAPGVVGGMSLVGGGSMQLRQSEEKAPSLTQIPSVIGVNAWFSDTEGKTASELIGEDIALKYGAWESKAWSGRPKSDIPAVQFGYDVLSGAALLIPGTATKATEISLQGMNLFAQAGAHQTARQYGIKDYASETGSSLWNFGSTPAMLVAAPVVIGVVGGVGGATAAATGISGYAAGSTATQLALGGMLIGYSVEEGGKIKNEAGDTTEWNLGKGVGTGLGLIAGFKIGADVLKGKNPSPIKIEKVPIQNAVLEPYKINIPIKEGAKLPLLGATERSYIELPFVRKTITPSKDITVLYGQIGQKTMPVMARNPEGQLFFGGKPITTKLQPTSMIGEQAPYGSPIKYRIAESVLSDYYGKTGTYSYSVGKPPIQPKNDFGFSFQKPGESAGMKGITTKDANLAPRYEGTVSPNIGETPYTLQRLGIAKGTAEIVYGKEVPIKSSVKEIAKLNPENEPYADYLAGRFKAYDVKVYGSQTAKLAGGLPERRIPADFDVFQPENQLKFAFGNKPKAIRFRDEVLKGLNQQAREKGQPHEFYVNPKESELLIQQRNIKTGESRHFIDLHTEGYLTASEPGQMAQPPPFGFNAAKESRDMLGQKVSTIGGEASNKLQSVVMPQQRGFSPAEHRIAKDIGDAFSESRFAAKEGDQFLMNRIINRVIGKKPSADYEKVEMNLGEIRQRLPARQRTALEEYELEYSKPQRVLISASKSKTPSISVLPITGSASPSISTRKAAYSPSIDVKKAYSPSVSPSASIMSMFSVSPSVSKATSPSYSPSISPSILPSFSPSVSKATSPSYSPSISPSISPYISPSISPSPSPSPSPSKSTSPSPSPSPPPYYTTGGMGGMPNWGGIGGIITGFKGKGISPQKRYSSDLFSRTFGFVVRGKSPGMVSGLGIRPVYIQEAPKGRVSAKRLKYKAPKYKTPKYKQTSVKIPKFKIPKYGGKR